MKNIVIYYLCILGPLALVFWMNSTDLISSRFSLLLITLYVFFYRPYIDGKRLSDKKIIAKKDIWKMVLPGSHMKYFSELYLK
ncbi:hypothetical protein [Formosa haliotis]|uniref:hypothetical protein n=1 Tax=Formosa haliotis TaxID=1555194 RepID=UPI0008260D87|nr:hypothetical protein [Formosa haliotis]